MSYSNSMSSYIESEGPPSTLSSFGSTKDESLSVEDMEHLIRKLRKENKALQLRVLGVNELARLLQDRNEVSQVLKEKNKRLEVAVVRLENRCANLEQKMRSEGGPTSLPKSGQAPMIPGPSRQILEGLVKENSELKKALNNMQRKGATGYLEAVVSTGEGGGEEVRKGKKGRGEVGERGIEQGGREEEEGRRKERASSKEREEGRGRCLFDSH